MLSSDPARLSLGPRGGLLHDCENRWIHRHCPQLRPGLCWAASLHLVTSAGAAGGGQISNWIFISHYFKLARKWTHWSTAHCSICPYWFLKGCQNKVLVNNCFLQCHNSWLMSRPELEHVDSNNNITMTLPKQKREPRLQCRQNALDHKPSGLIFHANKLWTFIVYLPLNNFQGSHQFWATTHHHQQCFEWPTYLCGGCHISEHSWTSVHRPSYGDWAWWRRVII